MMFSRCGQGLMVLHERQSRFSMVCRPADRKAVPTARTIARQLGKLPHVCAGLSASTMETSSPNTTSST